MAKSLDDVCLFKLREAKRVAHFRGLVFRREVLFERAHAMVAKPRPQKSADERGTHRSVQQNEVRALIDGLSAAIEFPADPLGIVGTHQGHAVARDRGLSIGLPARHRVEIRHDLAKWDHPFQSVYRCANEQSGVMIFLDEGPRIIAVLAAYRGNMFRVR